MENQKQGPTYTKLKKENIQQAIELIQTIRCETIPVADHRDPGAIQDCWNSLSELVTLMAAALVPQFEEKTFADKAGQALTTILNTDYPGAKPFMDPYEGQEKAIQDFIIHGHMLFGFDGGDAEEIRVGSA